MATKKKYLFPLILTEKAGDNMIISTTVRFKRKKKWYEVYVQEKYPLQPFSTMLQDRVEATPEMLAKLNEVAYKVKYLFRVEGGQAGCKLSPIQMSEKERLNLIHRMPLEGLENLI